MENNREQIIVRTSIYGIAANLLLAGFKAFVGMLSNSIAVVLDAVNNLSDALSSMITIIGAKLANRKPDKKHPLGHGRIEFLTAMIIAAIVLYAGITSFTESVKKILHPVTPEYSAVTLLILAAAVGVKIVLGRYVKKRGEEVDSGSLVASGQDALSDAALSFSVLLCAVIYLVTKISLEAYVGVVISVFIIKAGYEMLSETLDDILGKRMDREFLSSIRKTICEEENVKGAYDLILHSYGPDRMVGSVHVEVPGDMTAPQIDQLERSIASRVYDKHKVILTGIGIYAADLSDRASSIRSDITRMLAKEEGVLQLHGFYIDTEKKQLTFDVILDLALPDREEKYKNIVRKVQEAYPDYTVSITMDLDF